MHCKESVAPAQHRFGDAASDIVKQNLSLPCRRNDIDRSGDTTPESGLLFVFRQSPVVIASERERESVCVCVCVCAYM